jgi:hypothetical protein
VEFRPSHGLFAKLCRPHARWRSTGCYDATAGPTLVACVDGGRLRVYVPTRRMHLSWRVPVVTTYLSQVYEAGVGFRGFASGRRCTRSEDAEVAPRAHGERPA